jgi:hypothetical protein
MKNGAGGPAQVPSWFEPGTPPGYIANLLGAPSIIHGACRETKVDLLCGTEADTSLASHHRTGPDALDPAGSGRSVWLPIET